MRSLSPAYTPLPLVILSQTPKSGTDRPKMPFQTPLTGGAPAANIHTDPTMACAHRKPKLAQIRYADPIYLASVGPEYEPEDPYAKVPSYVSSLEYP